MHRMVYLHIKNMKKKHMVIGWHWFCKDLSNVHCIMVDLSKAFDKINYGTISEIYYYN